MTLRPLPEEFLFGVGTSDCQCEAFVPEFADIRDLWYERRQLQPRGRATDFWNRFREDVALAQALGCKMFRFSVAWARVEPQFGNFNQDALDHYSEVVDTIRAAGMEPLATLHHFTWPVHIETRGGLQAPDFPSTFATYVARVAQRFGVRVKYWLTFNEPNMLAFGYIKPWWERNYFAPPGLPAEAGIADQMRTVVHLMRNLFLAHTSARAAIKDVNPAAMAGVNPVVLGLPVWFQRFLDRNVINLRTEEDAEQQGPGFAERQFIEQGKVDVLVAIFTKTAERAARLDFADVYFMAAQRLLVTAASAVQSAADLARRPVAVVKTSTAETAIRTTLPQSDPLLVDDHEAGLKALDAGKASAFLSDDTRLFALLRLHPGRYRLLEGKLTEEPYAPAVTKGNPLFLEAVDEAVREFIGSGAWAESYRRNIGEPVPDAPRLPRLANLADVSGAAAGLKGRRSDLLNRVRERGRIRIGVKDNVPGLGYRDPSSGQWSGLEIDLARAIARGIFGSEQALELVAVTTQERIPFLRSLFRFLDPLLKAWGLITTSATSNWWQLGMAGKLRPFLCPAECVGQMDFVGLDYYWGLGWLGISRIVDLVEALAGGRFEKAPVFPEALYNWLKEYGRMFPKLPILVVENGCVAAADGIDRATYLKLHLKQLQRAASEGVNVAGYLCWSITSNRELGHRFAPDSDFGLHHVELDSDPGLAREPTISAQVYREIIQKRSVPES